MSARAAGLWRHPGFVKLWAGQTISLFGSQVTALALPLAAVLTLHATPLQMGLLGAVQYAPFLIIGLPAGAWVDRLPRRPIMLVADLGRALLLGCIPAAALLGVLRIELLYAVGLLTGVLTVFFDVAYQAFLPSLVRRDQLVEGNSKLGTSASVAAVAGLGLAGAFVQLFTAATAIIIDAASFLVSVLFLSLIRVPEAVERRSGRRRSLWAEVREGMRLVVASPVLRGIAGCTGTGNFFGYVMQAVFVLYLTQRLHFTPALVGIANMAIAVGSIVGALLAARLARLVGLGRLIVVGMAVAELPWLAVPALAGPRTEVVPVLTAAMFIAGLGGTIYNINQVSLRQAITPDHLQGRMNATMRFFVWGTIPLGSLAGGLLGERVGLRLTLMIGACGAVLAVPWVLCSPLRSLRVAPVSPAPVTIAERTKADAGS